MTDTLVLINTQFYRRVQIDGCLNGEDVLYVPISLKRNRTYPGSKNTHPHSVEQINTVLSKHRVNLRVKRFKETTERGGRED